MQAVGWCKGMDDDHPELCDECWAEEVNYFNRTVGRPIGGRSLAGLKCTV